MLCGSGASACLQRDAVWERSPYLIETFLQTGSGAGPFYEALPLSGSGVVLVWNACAVWERSHTYLNGLCVGA